MSENLYNDLYCDRSIRTDLTVPNNRPDRFMLDRTTKEAYVINVAIPVTAITAPSLRICRNKQT
jgi:hypothetical protein